MPLIDRRVLRLQLPVEAQNVVEVIGPGLEVADRLQQADIPHLHQFLSRYRAAQVGWHAGPDQALVTGDEQLARCAYRWVARGSD
jgi:hypothetical protein